MYLSLLPSKPLTYTLIIEILNMNRTLTTKDDDNYLKSKCLTRTYKIQVIILEL